MNGKQSGRWVFFEGYRCQERKLALLINFGLIRAKVKNWA